MGIRTLSAVEIYRKVLLWDPVDSSGGLSKGPPAGSNRLHIDHRSICGKASPPVGSGCQGSFQTPEGKAGILLAEQGFVLFTESGVESFITERM